MNNLNYYIYNVGNIYTIFGYIIIKGKPNISNLVSLHNYTTGQLISQTVTDKNGKYVFKLNSNNLPFGTYIIKFNADGIINKPEPEGNWPVFNIHNFINPFTVNSFSTNGYLFKFNNQTCIPNFTTLSVIVTGLTNIIYKWKKGNNIISGATGNSLHISNLTQEFNNSDILNYSCVFNGYLNNQLIEDIEISFILQKINTLDFGSNIVYRGVYDPLKAYFKTDRRIDLVKYNGNYYYCLENTPNPAGQFDTTKWAYYGDQYDLVATDLILTSDLVVDKKITFGSQTNNGIIESYNFNNNGGFKLIAGNENKFFLGKFNENNIISGIKWENNVFSWKGTNAELTPDGKFWVKEGGFGGSSLTDAPLKLNSSGLVIGNTKIKGSVSWPEGNTNVKYQNNFSISTYGNVTNLNNSYNLINIGSKLEITYNVSNSDINKLFNFQCNVNTLEDTKNNYKYDYKVIVTLNGSNILTENFYLLSNKQKLLNLYFIINATGNLVINIELINISEIFQDIIE